MVRHNPYNNQSFTFTHTKILEMHITCVHSQFLSHIEKPKENPQEQGSHFDESHAIFSPKNFRVLNVLFGYDAHSKYLHDNRPNSLRGWRLAITQMRCQGAIMVK